MWRIVTYCIIGLVSAMVIVPYRVAAAANVPDSLHALYDEHEPGDFDYVLPAEAMSGTIPFTLAGNLIIIQAEVDSEKGNFILDTGAPGLVLNLTYFRYYPASVRSDQEAGGISGMVAGASPTLVKKLDIGGFQYSMVNAHRVNLGHIENIRGIKILGLLGAGLFSRFEMMIDYENEVIHLHRVARSARSGHKSVYHASRPDYSVIPIQLVGGKILMKASIGKQKLNFVLDTGAETNILDSRLPGSVFEKVEMERKITLNGTGSKKMDAWYGRVKELSFGQAKLAGSEFLVTSLKQMSEAFGTNIDGMLGYTFLSRQKIVINFLNNELYLWK